MNSVHNISRRYYMVLAILVLVGGIGYTFIRLRSNRGDVVPPMACTQEAKLCSDGSSVGRVGPRCEFASCPKEDMIIVESPRPYEEVSSPVVVEGRARGNWFFEASFPVKVIDRNGNVLGVMPVMTNEEWMTTEFVSFRAEVPFSSVGTKEGFVIFEKDNPSGLPEYADELKVPVFFR